MHNIAPAPDSTSQHQLEPATSRRWRLARHRHSNTRHCLSNSPHHDLSVLAEPPETVRSRLSSVIGVFAALVLREGVADLPLLASRPWNCEGVSKPVRVKLLARRISFEGVVAEVQVIRQTDGTREI
jgi:hypothetical protein